MGKFSLNFIGWSPGLHPGPAHARRGPGSGHARPGRVQEVAGEGLGAPQVLRLRLLGRRRCGRLAPILLLQELALPGQAELPGTLIVIRFKWLNILNFYAPSVFV